MPNLSRKTGEIGETLARGFLEDKNYLILEKNINFSNFEIDIIAKKNKKYFIIEVKTSSSFSTSDPEDFMTQKKLKNLKKAAYFFSKKEKIKLENIYFDLIAIKLDKIKRIAKIKHYKNIC